MNNGSRTVPSAVRRFGIIDLVIVAAIAATATAFIPVMRDAGPGIVCVRCDGNVVARYPLDRCAEFRIKGAEGPLDIRIDRDGAAVAHATCRNGICVHTGHVSHSGEKVICAPNHVVMEIQKSHADESPDAVAR